MVREELVRQAKAAEESQVIAKMLSEYRAELGGGGGGGGLRDTLYGIFAKILGPDKNPDEDEIEVRDLIVALKKDSAGDGGAVCTS